MRYDHFLIKYKARKFCKINRNSSVRAFVIYFVVHIFATLPYLLGYLSFIDSRDYVTFLKCLLCYTAASLFIEGIVYIGLCGWFRRRIYEIRTTEDILGSFKTDYLGKLVLNFILSTIVFIFSLFFIIPGLYLSYKYSMAYFIKEENPRISPKRAMTLSGIITKGHVFDLFYLSLSFLGWNLLAIATLGMSQLLYSGPYFIACRAFAYEELKAEAAAAGKIDISEITGIPSDSVPASEKPKNSTEWDSFFK